MGGMTPEEVLQLLIGDERDRRSAGGISTSANEICFEGGAPRLLQRITEIHGTAPSAGAYCTQLLALSIDAELRPETVTRAEEKELLDMFGHMLLERGIPDTDNNKRTLANLVQNAALAVPEVNMLEIPLESAQFEWTPGYNANRDLEPFTLSLAGATTMGYLGAVVPTVREMREGRTPEIDAQTREMQALPPETRAQIRAITDGCYSNIMNSNLNIGMCMGVGSYEGIMQITPDFLQAAEAVLPPQLPTQPSSNQLVRNGG